MMALPEELLDVNNADIILFSLFGSLEF